MARMPKQAQDEEKIIGEMLSEVLARTVVPKGNVLYALVVTKDNPRDPVILQAYDPLPVPEIGSEFEAINDTRRYIGKVERVYTVVSKSGPSINTATHVKLG